MEILIGDMGRRRLSFQCKANDLQSLFNPNTGLDPFTIAWNLIIIPKFCTKYRSEAQKALCLKRSWSDFDPQAYNLYGENQNHETSFKDKALQALGDSWWSR